MKKTAISPILGEIEAMKLERLRTEVQIGIEASKAGHSTEYDTKKVGQLAAEIKAEGRERANAKA